MYLYKKLYIVVGVWKMGINKKLAKYLELFTLGLFEEY